MNDIKKASTSVTGIVLAGGQGQRMSGQDKGWITLSGKPLIEHVLKRLAPQVTTILISANRNLDAYKSLGYEVISDNEAGVSPDDQYEGPIAGILSCLEQTHTEFAAIVPCDAPLLPHDLVATLLSYTSLNQSQGHKLILFRSGNRLQPLLGLYHRSLASDMRTYFDGGGRKLIAWCESQRPLIIDAPEKSRAFTNINTPEDLTQLEASD